MTYDKNVLIEQMNEQRFLPITDETFALYHAYASVIDPHNPEEISQLLFYEGECSFRLGNFNDALSQLTRCIHAPKPVRLKYLDALSYNIIGLIYSFLGQETIAISDLLECKTISEEYHYNRELSVCYINLGAIYYSIEDYDVATKYYKMTLEHLTEQTAAFDNLRVLCLSYLGIVYCKTGRKDAALELFSTIQEIRKEYPELFYEASILNFYIRLYDFLPDDALFETSFSQLLQLASSNVDFLELSEFYFDVGVYLLSHGFKEKSRKLLNYLHNYTDRSALVFLQYQLQRQELTYARLFSDNKTYLNECSKFIALRPSYQEEQRTPKLYSLEYIERLQKMKSDSEMYREKSQLDPMTGLLNKYTIRFLVEEDLAAQKNGRISAMLLIDLDHFKQINDTLGHLAGDTFILQTAAAIRDFFKDRALCGRVGGDEFLIYISSVSDPSTVMLQAELIRKEIFRKTSEQNITITTQASIGVAFSSDACYDYETLFSAVDAALYRAKTEGRNKVVIA